MFRPLRYSKDFWICLTLFGVAFAIRFLLARQLVFPQLDDPASYIQVARNIALGRGLVSDVIWNFWVPFNSLTHPSNEFWMPLTSWTMAVGIRLGGDTLLAAQLPGILFGSLLMPVMYLIGHAVWPAQRRTTIKLVAMAALSYGAVAGLWWLRNSIAFGTMQPVPLMTVAASWEYADWYNYANQPTFAAMLAAGWQANLNLRWDAVLKDLGVILTMTFPLGLIGLPIVVLRREPIFRLFTLYALTLFFGISLILPSSGPGGQASSFRPSRGAPWWSPRRAGTRPCPYSDLTGRRETMRLPVRSFYPTVEICRHR